MTCVEKTLLIPFCFQLVDVHFDNKTFPEASALFRLDISAQTTTALILL